MSSALPANTQKIESGQFDVKTFYVFKLQTFVKFVITLAATDLQLKETLFMSMGEILFTITLLSLRSL